jgi:prepilin-type N-terminal cleavage/methylation domain-containing protein
VTRRQGFSLLEALIAMTIASVLVILVSSVFLAQNNFYVSSLARSRADDAVRTAAEFLAGELRTTQVGAVVTAEERRMVVRVPVSVGGVCDEGSGIRVHMYVPGASSLDSTEVGGYAVEDSVGAWAYTSAAWASMLQGIGVDPAADCENEGTDTTGITADFVEMDIAGPGLGDLVMFYKEVEYQLAPSQLDPGMLAVFRGSAGSTLVELASGFRSVSKFEYRVGGSFSTSVTSSSLDSIREVQFTLEAAGEGDSTTTDGYAANLAVRVPLAGSR